MARLRNLARRLLDRVQPPRWDVASPVGTSTPAAAPTPVSSAPLALPRRRAHAPGLEAEHLSECVCAFVRDLTDAAHDPAMPDDLAAWMRYREAARGLRVFAELYPDATISGAHVSPIHRALRKVGRMGDQTHQLQSWRNGEHDPALALVFDLLLDRHETALPDALVRARARLAGCDFPALRAAVDADLDRVIGRLLRTPVDPDARLDAYVRHTLDRAVRERAVEGPPRLDRAAWRLRHATALLEPSGAPRSEALRAHVDALDELVTLTRAARATFEAAASLRAGLSPRCTTLRHPLTQVLARMEGLRGEFERETRRVLLPWTLQTNPAPSHVGQ